MNTISPQSQRLDGQTALVTGATSGLGRAVAQGLAQKGAQVVVHGRDPDRSADTVAAIASAGGTARFVAADLGSHPQRAAVSAPVEAVTRSIGAGTFGTS